ncbi:hypothetical protein RRG08_052126 [Elysia crispata]|uniref:Uncharacterized protein n=1 Tax=Elysia crispata TaxID=231223 RepID=A0AAE1A498_9GAST|nr:hypothetical protein RRG08_052126 [Elysia crispata]
MEDSRSLALRNHAVIAKKQDLLLRRLELSARVQQPHGELVKSTNKRHSVAGWRQPHRLWRRCQYHWTQLDASGRAELGQVSVVAFPRNHIDLTDHWTGRARTSLSSSLPQESHRLDRRDWPHSAVLMEQRVSVKPKPKDSTADRTRISHNFVRQYFYRNS